MCWDVHFHGDSKFHQRAERCKCYSQRGISPGGSHVRVAPMSGWPTNTCKSNSRGSIAPFRTQQTPALHVPSHTQTHMHIILNKIIFKKKKNQRSMGSYLWSQHSGDRDRQISVSCREIGFQASQGFTMRPCCKNKNKNRNVLKDRMSEDKI